MSRALEPPGARALVAGGSLAGLAAGLELRAAGLRVSIHERSERVRVDRGAGPGLLKTVAGPFTFQQLPRSHIRCYVIPGATAAHRRF